MNSESKKTPQPEGLQEFMQRLAAEDRDKIKAIDRSRVRAENSRLPIGNEHFAQACKKSSP